MGKPAKSATKKANAAASVKAAKPKVAKATKPTRPTKAAKAAKPAATEALDLPELTGSQQHYETFLPAALALDASAVRPYRIDPTLAYHNVQRAVDALLPHAERIAKELPAFNLEELRALPDLALAVTFAASQVDRGGGASPDLPGLLAEAWSLRETMLTAAVALAAAGVVPKREVEKIQVGRGAIDAAQDCVDLPALFRRHAAAVRGKTTVTAAHMSRAATVGTTLLQRLRKKSVKRDRAPKGALKEAIDARDRLASLLGARHERARRVAYWLWGDAFDAPVPSLQARVVDRGKTKTSKKSSPVKPTAAKVRAGADQASAGSGKNDGS